MHIKRDDCFNDLIAENRIYDKVLSLLDIKEKEVERNQIESKILSAPSSTVVERD